MKAILFLVAIVSGCGHTSSAPAPAPAPAAPEPAAPAPTPVAPEPAAPAPTPASTPTQGAGSAVAECAAKRCGPALGVKSKPCADGSMGGPTGRCLEHADKTCGWEIRSCP